MKVAQHVLMQIESELRRLHQSRVDDLLVRLIKRWLPLLRCELLVFHGSRFLPLRVPPFIIQELADCAEDVNAIIAGIVHAVGRVFLPLFRLNQGLS